jgi:hypothetical protein
MARVFSYYRRLTAAQQRIYRRSDEVGAIRLRDPVALRPFVGAVAEALARESRGDVELACRRLLQALAADLGVAPVRVRVLPGRPHSRSGELHGLYQPAERGQLAEVTVWMRTARRRQVVAFRTFLRTLLHELVHHLDEVLLGLRESFHTEGFYKRESSLFHQLVATPAARDRSPAPDGPDAPGPTLR